MEDRSTLESSMLIHARGFDCSLVPACSGPGPSDAPKSGELLERPLRAKSQGNADGGTMSIPLKFARFVVFRALKSDPCLKQHLRS